MKAAPAACELLAGVEVLKGMNDRQARKVPNDAPTSFVRKRWENLVCTEDGLDRRFYELCVLSELKNLSTTDEKWFFRNLGGRKWMKLSGEQRSKLF